MLRSTSTLTLPCPTWMAPRPTGTPSRRQMPSVWRPPIATVRRSGTAPHTLTHPQHPQPHAVVAQSADVAASTSGDTDKSAALQLDSIRQSLIRQEDTIIFALIERAQFARNEAVYRADDRIPVPAFGTDGRRYSLLEYILREQEQLHGRVRRYTSPDEHAFFPDDLPAMVLPPLGYEQVLAPGAAAININDRVMDLYLHHILPNITQPGDDSNYGSSVTHDVWALQALSKRIHFGKFVAEAKFLAERDTYSALIRAGDAEGIMDRITDAAVELKVVERIRRKAATFGQDITGAQDDSHSSHYKVSPDEVAALYERWVMPMTKDVQVTYLLQRLDAENRHAQ